VSEEKKKLGPDSSIRELLDAVYVDEGTNVVPVTLREKEDHVEMMIIISGKPAEANVVMANLMSLVNDMHSAAEQMKADSEILGSDGKPVGDDPTIIVP